MSCMRTPGPVLLTSVVFSLGLASGVVGEPWLRAAAGFILRTIVPPPAEPPPVVDDSGDAATTPLFAAIEPGASVAGGV
jgi:hypothetical protein